MRVMSVFDVMNGLLGFVLNERLSHCVVYQQSPRSTYWDFQGKQAVVSIPLETTVYLFEFIECTV